MNTPLPTLFVSHGSPMLAIEPGTTGAALARMGADLPRPQALLVVSPHWMTSTLHITARAQHHAIHDFGGFPEVLYTLDYPAPGAPVVAQQVQQCLQDAGYEVSLDTNRSLDHGAWVPLRWMYPQADLPVLQLSLPPWPTAQQWALGQALAPLRERGVLIVGSGAFTHNLHEFFHDYRHVPLNAGVEPYAEAFRHWMVTHLQAHDVAAVLDYRQRAPHAVRAHPSEEHLWPLFIAWGAAAAHQDARIERLNDEMTYRILAMDAFSFT